MGKPTLTVAEQQKIKVLHATGKTYHAIAKEVGRSPHTVKSYLIGPTVQGEVKQIKADLADMFEDVARRMVASITDDDIKKLDAYRRTLSGGIATDKMRLLRDQSTENVSVRGQVEQSEETIRKLQELMDILGIEQTDRAALCEDSLQNGRYHPKRIAASLPLPHPLPAKEDAPQEGQER